MSVMREVESLLEGLISEADTKGWREGYARREEEIIALLESCPKSEEWHIENVMTCEGRCKESWLDVIVRSDGQTARQAIIALIKGENV